MDGPGLPPHMSQDCIFCRIVDGELPSRSVYEDEDVLAFLDANPLAPGHTLVIPKAHHETLGDLPGLSGATLLGNGELVNIIDVGTI